MESLETGATSVERANNSHGTIRANSNKYSSRCACRDLQGVALACEGVQHGRIKQPLGVGYFPGFPNPVF